MPGTEPNDAISSPQVDKKLWSSPICIEIPVPDLTLNGSSDNTDGALFS